MNCPDGDQVYGHSRGRLCYIELPQPGAAVLHTPSRLRLCQNCHGPVVVLFQVKTNAAIPDANIFGGQP